MKYHLGLVMLLISLGAGIAQRQYLGIKSSYSRTTATTNSSASFYYQDGFSAGLTYEYEIEKNLYLGAELLYERRGYIDKIDLRDENGNDITSDYKVDNYFDYFSLPLKVSYTFGNKFFGLISAGICPAILQKSTIHYPKFDDNTTHFPEFTETNTERYSKFDLSQFIAFGCGHNIGSRFIIESSLRYQFSATSFNKAGSLGYFGASTLRHIALSFNLGIKYSL